MTDIFAKYDDLKAAAKQNLPPKIATQQQFTVALYRKLGEDIGEALCKAVESYLEADDCLQYGVAAGLPINSPSMQDAQQKKIKAERYFLEWWDTWLMPEAAKRYGKDRAIGIMFAIFAQLISFKPITTMRQMKQASARVAKSLNLWRDGCTEAPPNKGQSGYEKHWDTLKRLRGLKPYKNVKYPKLLHEICLRCEKGYANANPLEKARIRKKVRQGLSRLKEIEQSHAPEVSSGNAARTQRRAA